MKKIEKNECEEKTRKRGSLLVARRRKDQRE